MTNDLEYKSGRILETAGAGIAAVACIYGAVSTYHKHYSMSRTAISVAVVAASAASVGTAVKLASEDGITLEAAQFGIVSVGLGVGLLGLVGTMLANENEREFARLQAQLDILSGYAEDHETVLKTQESPEEAMRDFGTLRALGTW